MIRVRYLLAGLLALTWSLAFASDRELEWEDVGDWWGVAFDRAKKHCFATDITDFMIGWEDGELRLTVLDSDLEPLQLGAHYKAKLVIDGRSWQAKVFVDFHEAETTYLAWSKPPKEFIDAFKKGEVLSGTVGGVRIKDHPLEDTAAAMEALERCVAKASS